MEEYWSDCGQDASVGTIHEPLIWLTEPGPPAATYPAQFALVETPLPVGSIAGMKGLVGLSITSAAW